MSTELAQSGPEASMESRISSYLSGKEPEPVEDQPEEAPRYETEEQAAEREDKELEQEAKPESEVIEWETDTGEVVKVDARLKTDLMSHKDYVQKTQHLAVQQKLAEDLVQYTEAMKQLLPVVAEDHAELRAIQKELAKYEGVDWQLLYQSDPGQAFALQQAQKKLEKDYAAKESAIGSKAESIQRATAEHRKIQWAEAEKGARNLIGSITPEDNVAMAQTVINSGLTAKQFQDRYADPQVIAWVHKAAKWDALQAKKSSPKAETAPPVVKSGAVSPMSAQVRQDLSFRKAMKSTSNANAKARLIERNLAERFK